MKKAFLLLFCICFLTVIFTQGKIELVGQLSKEKILEHFPGWEKEADSYFPNEKAIKNLKSLQYKVHIEVFLGTWCTDSKKNVSAFFKIMEAVDNPFLLTTYIGLPNDKDSRQTFIQGKNIVSIPTFILFMNGREKGRIVEKPFQSVDEDLVDIIGRIYF